LGLPLLFAHEVFFGVPLIGIAILSPMATALSDYLSKWLLQEGELTRSEVLFSRFLPAGVATTIFVLVRDGGATDLL